MLSIRPETLQDRVDIHHVNEAAFGQESEAELVEKLRNRGMPVISLVVLSDGQLVGHIAFSPVTVKSENSTIGPAITQSNNTETIACTASPENTRSVRNQLSPDLYD